MQNTAPQALRPSGLPAAAPRTPSAVLSFTRWRHKHPREVLSFTGGQCRGPHTVCQMLALHICCRQNTHKGCHLLWASALQGLFMPWVGLEGTLKISQLQAPVMSRNTSHQSRLLQAQPSWPWHRAQTSAAPLSCCTSQLDPNTAAGAAQPRTALPVLGSSRPAQPSQKGSASSSSPAALHSTQR